MMERSEAHVGSGLVMTVDGAIPAAEMGVTLMHEHILLDASKLWQCPCKASEMAIAEAPVSIENIGELRMNPFLSRDNCFLLDFAADGRCRSFVEFATERPGGR